jgi:hypothetical protein
MVLLSVSDYLFWVLRKTYGLITSLHLGRHQGMVSNVIGGTLCIQLDNGRSENVELGKQAIRLIASRSKGGKRWNLFPICSIGPVVTLLIAMIMAGRVLPPLEVWHPSKHSSDHLLFMGGTPCLSGFCWLDETLSATSTVAPCFASLACNRLCFGVDAVGSPLAFH